MKFEWFIEKSCREAMKLLDGPGGIFFLAFPGGNDKELKSLGKWGLIMEVYVLMFEAGAEPHCGGRCQMTPQNFGKIIYKYIYYVQMTPKKKFIDTP